MKKDFWFNFFDNERMTSLSISPNRFIIKYVYYYIIFKKSKYFAVGYWNGNIQLFSKNNDEVIKKIIWIINLLIINS